MRSKKLLFSLFLALLAAIIAFSCVSCDKDEPETQDSTEATDAPRELISLEGYVFVYSANASRDVVASVRSAVDSIHASFGIRLTHTNDWMAIAPEEPLRTDDKEILVGMTNRAESLEADGAVDGKFTFAIAEKGSKIVIYGGSEEALIRGIEHFVSVVTAEESASIEKGYSFNKNYVDEVVSDGSVISRLASEYTIVYPVISNSGETAIAADIVSKVLEKTDLNMKKITDNSVDKGKEILIGSTSRTPSDVRCGYFDYSIKVSGQKIYVLGGSTAALNHAGTKLIELALSEEIRLDADGEYTFSIIKEGDINPIVNDITLFTPFWASSYTPPAWMFDFIEKTYAVTCPDGRITIKAHRGDSDNYPDNSIEGIASAILAGADCVEVDVRMTLDGIAVLLHDDSLAKGTDAASYVGKKGYPQSLSVTDWTYDQIKVLKMRDKGGNVTEYKVPTLYEALKLCAGRVFVQVDDKSGKIVIDSKEMYNLAKETGSEECFFYFYGVSLFDKWLSYDRENEDLVSYTKLCRDYLSKSGHSLRKPYWTNEVNKYDSGRFSETEDWWKKLSSEGKLMIWSQNIWKLSEYVSKNYSPMKP